MTKIHLVKAAGADDSTAQIVTGALPLVIPAAPGDYEIATAEMSAWYPVTVGATQVQTVSLGRRYTAGAGLEAVDLAAEGPAESGTASYALQGTAPAGISLAGSLLTIDPAAVATGASVVVRRSDGAGNTDFTLTVTLVTLAWIDTDGNGTYELQYGEDGSSTLSVPISSETYPAWNGTYTITATEQDSIEDGGVVVKYTTAIAVTDDVDASGGPTAGDVLGTGTPALVFAAVELAPTYRWQADTGGGWANIAGATSETLDSSGYAPGTRFRRIDSYESASSISNTLTLQAVSEDVTDTFAAASNTGIASFVGTSGLPWTFEGGTAPSGSGFDTADAAFVDAAEGALVADDTPSGRLYARGGTIYYGTCHAEVTLRRGKGESNGQGVYPAVMVSGNNGYWVRYNGTTNAWDLFRTVAGVTTRLGTERPNTAPGWAAPGDEVTLRIEATGSAVVVTLDGSEIFNEADGSLTSGKPGIRTYGDDPNVQYQRLVDFVGGGTS